jgi:hypothetical protein
MTSITPAVSVIGVCAAAARSASENRTSIGGASRRNAACSISDTTWSAASDDPARAAAGAGLI